METSFDVRVWTTEVYKGQKTTSYRVRWSVDGRWFKESFKTVALADGFRSDLVAATRRGEAFEVESGRPLSMQRASRDMTWYKLAVAFADMKWPRVAGTTRRTHAEALAKITNALVMTTRGMPSPVATRHALNRWAFNPNKRSDPSCPIEVRAVLRWLEANTLKVSALARKDVLRELLDSLTVRLDGRPAAASVVSRQRRILNTALEYAVELKILEANPIPGLKWTAPKSSLAVDRRAVANPVQVRTLLHAVREGRNGDRLFAFFGCLYFAALRPEEAVGLRKSDLAIPDAGWGELHLERAEPHVGKEWTNSGLNRDERQLKQRAVGEGRTVPCPPELTALLNEHIARNGLGEGGRVFVGERNKAELPKGTINRAWREARRAVFTPEVCATPLAETPYDLRHAMISFWLTLGIPPADVARWAGHSIEVLFRIYAAWLANSSQIWRNKIEEGLR